MLPLALLALLFAGPVLAQMALIQGEVRDSEGKPYPGVTLAFKSEQSGQVVETKTDKDGEFALNGLRVGRYMISVKVNGEERWHQPVEVKSFDNERVRINFKDINAKEGKGNKEYKETPEAAAARKKQEEERVKVEGMKAHFDAGRTLLEEAIAARNEIQKTPAADRGPLTEQMAQKSASAVSEFQAAQQAAPAGEKQLHIVLYNLGQAYDIGGHYDEAIATYTRAIELKGDVAGYYQALGTAQARGGKVTEAMATCDKAAALSSNASAADATLATSYCYGNIGIILQNAAKMKESIEPFQKATQLNPKNADNWIYLGRGLLNAMEYKMEGGEMKMVFRPGTTEAFQKYLELEPEGRFAEEATGGLAALGTPIQTKVSNKKAKKP
jgi:tetratricopeptide (TPR) repeat protein